MGTSFEQYEDVFISPTLRATFEDIEVQSTSTASIKSMGGSYSNLDLIYGLTIDKRNQVFQPTDGYRATLTQSIPIVLDRSSFLNGVDFSSYHSFSDENIVGSMKLWGRSIHGINDEDVRLTNRLFLPSKKLRGFQFRKVGPKDGNDYVGGNYATALNFEAALPNLLPESTKTDISVFLDTANLWHVDYSDTLEDASKIRSSLGIAANVYSTIGPLSFTVAQNITKQSTDLTETFNFRLGTSF